MGDIIWGIKGEIVDTVGFCCGARMVPTESDIAAPAHERIMQNHVPVKPKQKVCSDCRAKFGEFGGLGHIGGSSSR